MLDLGCGPGFTSLELAQIVGARGRVIARDQSARFLDHLRTECDRLALAHVEPSLGPVEELDLADASLDAVYARWLFCWLDDPGAVLANVARCLKRGGHVVLQEYLDWGAMKLLPASAVFDRAVAACMQSWAEGGGTIDVMADLPALARRAGLEIEHFAPVARIGAVGSIEWRWLGEFFAGYLPKLVGTLLAEGEVDAFRSEWTARTDEGSSSCYTPVLADAILRKPRNPSD